MLALSNWKRLFTRPGVELRPRSIELVESCLWIRKGLRETNALTGDDSVVSPPRVGRRYMI